MHQGDILGENCKLSYMYMHIHLDCYFSTQNTLFECDIKGHALHLTSRVWTVLLDHAQQEHSEPVHTKVYAQLVLRNN